MSGMQLTTLACSLEERFREGVHVSLNGRRVHTFPQDKVVSIFDAAAQRVHNIMQHRIAREGKDPRVIREEKARN